MITGHASTGTASGIPVAQAGRAVGRMRSPATTTRRALQFAAALLGAALLLQRFGLPLGSKSFSVVGPIGIGLSLFAITQGTLILHRFRLIAFLTLTICVIAGAAWHALVPGIYADFEPNIQSLSQFLLLSSFAVLTFAEPVDEHEFFRRVGVWLLIVGIAGIVEFLAQFFGVGIFAFTGLLPHSLLFESGYNLQIPLGVRGLFKSNGFFLVEPSIFSQMMALGLIIEIVAFRRALYLTVYVGGLLLSFSGTGWIVLGSFVVAATISMGWRGIMMAGTTTIVLGVLLSIGSVVAPDVANAVLQRSTELSRQDTSGHLRFITPFWAADDMLSAHPSAALAGLGAGLSERLNLPYAYNVNTPSKILLDYGFPALMAYILLFVGGRKSPIQSSLLVPCCVLFFFTGGYQEFPPMLFLVLLLISVARLSPSPASARMPPHKS